MISLSALYSKRRFLITRGATIEELRVIDKAIKEEEERRLSSAFVPTSVKEDG